MVSSFLTKCGYFTISLLILEMTYRANNTWVDLKIPVKNICQSFKKLELLLKNFSCFTQKNFYI